jgi:transposase
MANMLTNHHLAKSIQDAGWSRFLSTLSFKAVGAGKRAVAVPPASTSQTCSGCGVLVHKGLTVRWHACPDGGTNLHRDHNAARNRERLGQRRRGAVASAAAENQASPMGSVNLLWSLAQARAVTSDWKTGNNHPQRHSALGYQPPTVDTAAVAHP